MTLIWFFSGESPPPYQVTDPALEQQLSDPTVNQNSTVSEPPPDQQQMEAMPQTPDAGKSQIVTLYWLSLQMLL